MYYLKKKDCSKRLNISLNGIPKNRDPGLYENRKIGTQEPCGALDKPGPGTLVGPYKNQNTGPGPGFSVIEGSQ